MIVFPCPHCQNELRAEEGRDSEPVHCGRCGRVAPIPAGAASTGGGTRTTGKPTGSDPLAKPAPDADERTAAGWANPHEQDTLSQGIPRPASELYDFLAPPQRPDELGRLGPYRILRVLGSGGMGVVFLAEDVHLERPVALKVMKPALAASDSARQRFTREARAMAALKHDHVVVIHQVGEDRGTPYLAMEFLEGELLDDRLRRVGKLPTAEVLRIGRETAEGLAAAHARGLIHRDIKPGNIWLEAPRGRVKLLDFGLARAAGDDAHLTQSGVILGTPMYMTPEQARGEPIDARCDLFSLGGVLYRMCTGQAPFKGSDAISTLVSVSADDPPPPARLAAVPPALSDLVMRLLAKDRDQRPASAAEVAEALRRIEAQAPAEAPSTEIISVKKPAVRAREDRPAWQSRWWKVAVVAAVVWVAVMILTSNQRRGRPVWGVPVQVQEPGVRVFVDGEEKLNLEGKTEGRLELSLGEHVVTVRRGNEELYRQTVRVGGTGAPPGVRATWQAKPRLRVRTGTTVIPCGFSWDVEEDKLTGGDLKFLFDVTHKGDRNVEEDKLTGGDLKWSPEPKGGRLTPINGAELAAGKAKGFDKLGPEDLKGMKFSRNAVGYVDRGGPLKPRAVLAVRTAHGLYAKLKVLHYFRMHDLDFPGHRPPLTQAWREQALHGPNFEHGHLEVEWVLYGSRHERKD
jgi:serine/threonine protein kinase